MSAKKSLPIKYLKRPWKTAATAKTGGLGVGFVLDQIIGILLDSRSWVSDRQRTQSNMSPRMSVPR